VVSWISNSPEPHDLSIEIPEPTPHWNPPRPSPYHHPCFKIYQQVRQQWEQNVPTEIKVEEYFKLLIALVEYLPPCFRKANLGDLIRLADSFVEIVEDSNAESQHLFIQLTALWRPQQ
jgi:hypothetical protein